MFGMRTAPDGLKARTDQGFNYLPQTGHGRQQDNWKLAMRTVTYMVNETDEPRMRMPNWRPIVTKFTAVVRYRRELDDNNYLQGIRQIQLDEESDDEKSNRRQDLIHNALLF